MDIKKLSIEEKVAQMLCFAFHGTEMNDQIKTLVQDLKVGGLISFARNITSLTQIAKLNQEIQDLADIPLFIGIDQEGGPVRRILSEITPLPGAMLLASGSTADEVYKINYHVGKNLREVGFNVNFAPVADVNNNPLNPVINSRSYSDDPKVVSKLATKAALAMQDASIIPTIKHFPGHGDTVVDSHLGLPVVNKTKEELEQLEIYPFKQAIENNVQGVMLSHVLYPAFDSKYPASMSKEIVTGLLKENLGFKGLIVTDSLTMGAISKLFKIEEVITHSANAGVDVLIFCGKADLEEQKHIYNTFVKLVKEGKIPSARIDESVQKILEFKKQYNIKKEILVKNDKISFDNQEEIKFSEELYEKGITYVGKQKFKIFTHNEKVLIIFPKIRLYTLVDNENDDYQTLGKYLDFDEIVYDDDSDLALIANKSKQYERIIFCTFNVGSNDYQTRMFSLLDKSKTLGISLRSPYDYLHLKALENFILAYEPTPEALFAVSKILTGKASLSGKPPIKI